MSERLTHGSLFSGIGGPEIAAEIMGWKNVFHCEINPFGRKILDYWFPNSKSYEDITKTDFREWQGKINVLTGGFPCQPFSCAGQRKGAEDDRYLWPEMLRAIREIQPDWVVGENVAGILTMVQPGSETALGREESLFGEVDRERTLHRQEYVVETVCNDLEREGYSVQPVVIPACAVGAPHRRDRVFFIAHRADAGSEGMQREWENNILSGGTATDTDSHRWRDGKNQQVTIAERKGTANIGTFREDGASSDSQCQGSGQIYKEVQSEQSDGHSFDSNGNKRNVAYSSSEGLSTLRFPTSIEKKKRENEDGCSVQPAGNVRRTPFAERWENFPTQSPVCSRDDGIFTGLDGIAFSKWRQESIKAYGNAIVPQVMYEIFLAIESIEKGK
jgi:DNA (cytosine-5)-methyltransferase 1